MKSFIMCTFHQDYQGYQIKECKMGETCRAHETDENTCSLVRKPERKISLGRTRHRWKDNIKVDLKETGCDDVDWIYMA
jgi:hypothetical protein